MFYINMVAINNKIFVNLIKQKDFNFKSCEKEIPNQKVSKGLTYLDVIAFRHYVDSKKFNMHFPKTEMDELYKKNGKDFIESSVNYLIKKLNLPPKLKPETNLEKEMQAGASYIPALNLITVNKKQF